MTYPSVYPTGATVYDPARCWNGYTIFQAKEVGALLIDMNGGEVQHWNLHGMPNRILPGGHLIGSTGERSTAFGSQDGIDLVQVDWDGNIVWRFDRYEYVEDPGEGARWMARQHHDYQREGNPVGYYAPGLEPLTDRGNTVVLAHKNLRNAEICDKPLLDDTIIEVDWDGDVVWEWVCSEHFEELGFREDARNLLFRNPNWLESGGGMGDWMHINSMSLLGPNRWYDAGDDRFHPDNLIWYARESNITAIVDKRSGQIVWRLGPNYDESAELRRTRVDHRPAPRPHDPARPAGRGEHPDFRQRRLGRLRRAQPRVADRLPQRAAGLLARPGDRADHAEGRLAVHPGRGRPGRPGRCSRFYSPFISSAQRLPNGNTLITEGSGGRLIEVTPGHEIVWEYISPYWGKMLKINMIYRAYRVPYDWVPQVDARGNGPSSGST